MPLYALIGHDGPDGVELRKKQRPAHLAHWKPLDAAGRVRFGGPLLDADGGPRGSLVVFEADDAEQARAQAEADPYVAQRIFDHYELHETRGVLPESS